MKKEETKQNSGRLISSSGLICWLCAVPHPIIVIRHQQKGHVYAHTHTHTHIIHRELVP